MGKVLQNRVDYTHNFARTMMGAIRIKSEVFSSKASARDVAQVIGSAIYWPKIRSYVEEHNHKVWGRLAAGGLGSGSNLVMSGECAAMSDVHHTKSWLDGYSQDHGDGIVLFVATTAVAAAVADNIWEDVKKERSRRADFEHTSPFRDETKAFLRGEDVDLARDPFDDR